MGPRGRRDHRRRVAWPVPATRHNHARPYPAAHKAGRAMSNEERSCPGIAAVVPFYNVGAAVAPVVAGLTSLTEAVIAVDDGSTDEGAAAIGAAGARVIRLDPNRGKGHAILAGMRAALEIPGVVAVAVADADGQHDPADLPGLYEVFQSENADLVIGSRVFLRSGAPLRSRFGNHLTMWLTRALFGRALPDTQSGYRIHSRRLVEDVLETVPGGRYETEMTILLKALREGYTVTTAPIQTIYEPGNRSSHFRWFEDSVRLYAKLFRAAFTRAPTRQAPPGGGPAP